jgi:hypothetical protein
VFVLPSLTLMTMFENVPTCVDVGVPDSCPVTLLNVAHTGRFWMLKPSVSFSASAALGRKLYACPTLAEVDGVPLIVGALFDESTTVIVNGVSPALTLPSLTRIWMLEYVPTLAAVGVPESCPVALLNVSHAGRFTTPKVIASPSGSEPVGRKLYVCPTVTEAGGVPLMVGTRFDWPPTVIENGASATVAEPSVTEIVMFEYVPALDEDGVPDSWPVVLLKLAHAGRLAMLKRSGSPFASLAVGRKLYADPAATEVRGVPEMTGATLSRRVARIANCSAELELVPSLTVMRMSFHSPTAVGVPLSRPVDVENDAHDGRF